MELDQLHYDLEKGRGFLDIPETRRQGQSLMRETSSVIGWNALHNKFYLEAFLNFQRAFALDDSVVPFEKFDLLALRGIFNIGAEHSDDELEVFNELVLRQKLERGVWSTGHNADNQNALKIFDLVKNILRSRRENWQIKALYLTIEGLAISPAQSIGYTILLYLGSILKVQHLEANAYFKNFETHLPSLKKGGKEIGCQILLSGQKLN